jgi:hypothetical protein
LLHRAGIHYAFNVTPVQNALIVAFALTAALVVDRNRQKKAEAMLRSWAQANAIEVISCKRCWLLPLHLLFSISFAQVVFRIVAREPGGHEREGVAICGGSGAGLFSEKVELQWK